LPADRLVRGAFNGGFVSRVPIQYFNVNIAVLAAKVDEWATMPDEVLINTRLERSSYLDNGTPRCCVPNMSSIQRIGL
jgi:hypothetical protein